MSSRLRRFEILLPLQFNDGSDVPPEWFGGAANELREYFGAVSYDNQPIEGQWRSGGNGLPG
jgi:hypothetical protein